MLKKYMLLQNFNRKDGQSQYITSNNCFRARGENEIDRDTNKILYNSVFAKSTQSERNEKYLSIVANKNK